MTNHNRDDRSAEYAHHQIFAITYIFLFVPDQAQRTICYSYLLLNPEKYSVCCGEREE